MNRTLLASTACLLGALSPSAFAGSGNLTLIQIGDLHGHMVPRPNVSSTNTGRLEGGLARMYTQIDRIRSQHKDSLLINAGDTIQGSAEALFTKGQAMVDVLNFFGIDAFTPGNWDFLYGTKRFTELFDGKAPKAPWGAVAANLYYDGEPYADRTGQRVLPPYSIRKVGDLKIGFLGFTTARGVPIISGATKGFKFTEGDEELKQFIPVLRNKEKVDLIVMVSELGLADNIRLAEANPGVDVVLSADMHEMTMKPVVTKTGTVISEVGQDGTLLGELNLQVRNGKMIKWDWKPHIIDERLPESPNIAALVREVRKTYVSGKDFRKHTNPMNGSVLSRPVDTVVGYTKVPLMRGNFSNENMPGVIEGSSHDFLTDAFRSMTGADIGAIRGFRYGTHVRPGPITLEDLYHYIPVGPQIAVGTIKGAQLKDQMENAAHGSLNPDVITWSGGWLFGYSGVKANLDPYQAKGKRFPSIQVMRADGKQWAALNPGASYTYASYYFNTDPDKVNFTPAQNIRVLKDKDGKPLDATEVVARYLASMPNRTVNPEPNRIHLTAPLPKPSFGNLEIQPLRGVSRPDVSGPGRAPAGNGSSGTAPGPSTSTPNAAGNQASSGGNAGCKPCSTRGAR